MQGGAGRCVSLPQVRQTIVIRCRSVQNPRARAMAAWTFELIDSAAPLDRPKLGAVEDPRPDGRGRGRDRVSTDQEGRDRAGSGRRTRPPLGRPRRRARPPTAMAAAARRRHRRCVRPPQTSGRLSKKKHSGKMAGAMYSISSVDTPQARKLSRRCRTTTTIRSIS